MALALATIYVVLAPCCWCLADYTSRAILLQQSQDELRALLEEPLLVAVELPDDAAQASGRIASTAIGTPSLAAQIKFLALKNLAGSLAVVRPHCCTAMTVKPRMPTVWSCMFCWQQCWTYECRVTWMEMMTRCRVEQPLMRCSCMHRQHCWMRVTSYCGIAWASW